MRLICWRVLLLWLKLRGEFGNMLPRMRDIETIDSELRLVAALRWATRECGRHPRRWMWRMRHWINAASWPTGLLGEVDYSGAGGGGALGVGVGSRRDGFRGDGGCVGGGLQQPLPP